MPLSPAEIKSRAAGTAHVRKRQVHDAFQGIYSVAIRQLDRSSDLFDIKTYVAMCCRFMQYQRDMRLCARMIEHLGRVLGHDKRTVNIEDNRSYQDILISLQKEMRTVDAELVVREVVNGATGAPADAGDPEGSRGREDPVADSLRRIT